MKHRNASPKTITRARGFVLMAAVLLLGMVGMAVLLSSLSSTNAATQQSLRTQLALKEAKEAVLGYILLDAPGGVDKLKPGSIPCPDSDNDNDSDNPDNYGNNCSGAYVNRFPGKNFRVGELRDAGNEKLWYAISPEFRSGAYTIALNSLTPATLRIDNQGEYVVVIFAAGSPLTGQTRTDATLRSDFLESDNASASAEFITGVKNVLFDIPFNDRVIGITKQEWSDTVLRRVSAEIIKALNEKKTDGRYPWATDLSQANAPLKAYSSSADPWMGLDKLQGLLPARKLWPPDPEPTSPPAKDPWPEKQPWQSKNDWHQLFYYIVAPAFAPGGDGICNTPSDCLTLKSGGTETTNIKALVVYAGARLDGQSRPGSVADYLEGEENRNGNNVFEILPPGLSNDRFYIIK